MLNHQESSHAMCTVNPTPHPIPIFITAILYICNTSIRPFGFVLALYYDGNSIAHPLYKWLPAANLYILWNHHFSIKALDFQKEKNMQTADDSAYFPEPLFLCTFWDLLLSVALCFGGNAGTTQFHLFALCSYFWFPR